MIKKEGVFLFIACLILSLHAQRDLIYALKNPGQESANICADMLKDSLKQNLEIYEENYDEDNPHMYRYNHGGYYKKARKMYMFFYKGLTVYYSEVQNSFNNSYLIVFDIEKRNGKPVGNIKINVSTRCARIDAKKLRRSGSCSFYDLIDEVEEVFLDVNQRLGNKLDKRQYTRIRRELDD
ncbi:hypothetical protein NECID01_1682 [Nematocida sp. AWRm77]|nr:hypothetical protein NECID01_1682 [Nematocida sp. AWRm77]